MDKDKYIEEIERVMHMALSELNSILRRGEIPNAKMTKFRKYVYDNLIHRRKELKESYYGNSNGNSKK